MGSPLTPVKGLASLRNTKWGHLRLRLVKGSVFVQNPNRTVVWGQTRGWAAGGSNKHPPPWPWMPGGQGTGPSMSRMAFCFPPKISFKEKKGALLSEVGEEREAQPKGTGC